MVATLLLCATAVLFGLVAVDRIIGPAVARIRQPLVERISFGGIKRLCVPAGGILLSVAIGIGLIFQNFVGLDARAVPSGFLVGFLLFSLTGLRIAMAARLLVLALCLAPDACPIVAGACLAPILMRAVRAADDVPGIPAALFAPAWIAGGVYLVLLHSDAEGLLPLVAGGGLLGLQAWHRFPPRIVLGPAGVVLMAILTGVLIFQLALRNGWLALALLWSFTWVETGFSLVRRGPGLSIFERARQRGEPENGLTLATLSLSVASVVFLWTALRQSAPIQWAASLVILALQAQFLIVLQRCPPVQRAAQSDGQD